VVEQLLNHINRHTLCKTTDKILVAVSGGLDSTVMFHLLKDAGFRIAATHCNFQLRGADSDADEEFVRDLCRQFKVPVYVQRFDTAEDATRRGISIQMAARDLRYNFFQETAKSHSMDHIATAHHFNDVIETVFLNVVRGTGMDGLRGIAPKKDNIIRPLLFATRQMILEYARKQNIEWREDASNSTSDYQRNFLRHQVIPKLVEMNPGFEESFRQTHERLTGARSFALEYIGSIKLSAVLASDEDSITLDIRKIQSAPAPAVLLWELIKELGFSYDQCCKVVEDHQPGKLFFSASHQLLVDRTKYFVEKKQEHDVQSQSIENGQRVAANGPVTLVLREVLQKDFTLNRDSSVAQLDADRLNFPMLWRKWQAGDYFIPLGMRSEKKVSDFLIDLKVPFNTKADITVLESAGEVVWIVGHRINERYKVTEATKRVLVIEPRQTSD
jgi:tRNA(Ile)-lysidine synthase